MVFVNRLCILGFLVLSVIAVFNALIIFVSQVSLLCRVFISLNMMYIGLNLNLAWAKYYKYRVFFPASVFTS